jgi:DnaJ-class molecular chaperone
MTRFENPDRWVCTNTKAHKYAERYKKQRGKANNPAGANQHNTRKKTPSSPPRNSVPCKSCRASGKGLLGLGKCPRCKGRGWNPPPSKKKKK